MRWCGFVLILSLGVGVSLAAAVPAVVQSTISAGTGSEDTHDMLYESNVTSGSLLVALCSVFQSAVDATDPDVSDTLANTWTVTTNQPVVIDSGTTTTVVRLYSAWTRTTSGGANTVTCDPPGSSDFITLAVVEVSDITATTPRDQLVINTDGGTPGTAVSSGTTGTTVQASEWLVGGMIYDPSGSTTVAYDSPLGLLEEATDYGCCMVLFSGSRVLSSTGTYSADFTLGASRYWVAFALTFKEDVPAVTRRGGPIVFP